MESPRILGKHREDHPRRVVLALPRFRFWLRVFSGVSLCLLLTRAQLGAESPSTFLWVECEGSNRTLDSLNNVNALLADAKDWGIDTLFVQVYRGNKAWFDSKLSDASPHQAFVAKEGKDMLQILLKKAHAQGIAVHAWVNVFRIGKDSNAKILQRLGKDVVTRDNKGRSMLDYPQLRLPDPEGIYFEGDSTGYWLDPGDPQAQKYLLSLLEELVVEYPSLDGVHLDFIRLPYVVPFSPGARFPKGITYGFGKESLKRFQSARGFNPLKWDGSTESALAWDDWRRDQVTDFVRMAQGLLKRSLPKGRLSAAVLCWGDRAYLTAFQDWRGWLDNGFVDFVAIMNYSVETKFFSHINRSALAFAGKRPVWIGLGNYLLGNREEVFISQIRDSIGQLQASQGALGFFSYDALKKTPNLIPLLKKETRGQRISKYGTDTPATIG